MVNRDLRSCSCKSLIDCPSILISPELGSMKRKKDRPSVDSDQQSASSNAIKRKQRTARSGAAADADLPFQRSSGRQFSRGCAARDTVVVLDNAVFFLGDDRIVYRAEEAPKRVSTFGIEERLRKCASIGDASALSFTVDGHAFYLLNIPGEGSFAFDVSSGQWAEWQSYGRKTFRGRCALTKGGGRSQALARRPCFDSTSLT